MAQAHNKKTKIYGLITDDTIFLKQIPLLTMALYVFVGTTIFRQH